MKYIFVAGAPGSKWSSVVKNIYYSPDIDRSDYRDEWTYYHDASGTMELMHLGAYFDPGMISPLPEDLTTLDRSQLEKIFAEPFQSEESTGTRIIKSHVFSNHIDYLRKLFPETPIVIVHRNNDACLGWWVKCGHFDITYPDYHKYYRNLKHMAKEIQHQNSSMYPYWDIASFAFDNVGLCARLGIDAPDEIYRQNYSYSKVRVKVL